MRTVSGIIGIVLLVGVLATPALADRLEVTPWWGYQVGGSLTVENGKLSLQSAPSFGITFDITVREDAQVELVYSRQDTELRFSGSPPPDTPATFDVIVEYYQLGGILYWPMGPEERFKPLFGMTVGATRFAPKDDSISDEWRFSFAFTGGAKYFFTSRVGVRGQGRLLLPYFASNSSIFCWLPGGCYVSVSGTAMVQADASLGLILAF
jgi:hypothetical protein